MYPPVPLLIRKANVDYKIPETDHIIKKGQQVIIPLVAFHYDERFWEEPNKFNPERFNTDEALNRKEGKLLHFGKRKIFFY